MGPRLGHHLRLITDEYYSSDVGVGNSRGVSPMFPLL